MLLSSWCCAVFFGLLTVGFSFLNVNGTTVIVKVAHARLGHSRMLFVRAYPRETQEMVFDAHDRVFAFFKGACTRGIYDNMKTAVEAILVVSGALAPHTDVAGRYRGRKKPSCHAVDQVTRTEFGRPRSRMRLRISTAMATSVTCASSV